MNTPAQNRASHAKRKQRQRAGIASIAGLRDDLNALGNNNALSDEQEREAERLIYGIGGITWAILEHRRANGQHTREDARKPCEIRQFDFDRFDFSYRARSA